MSSRRLCVYVWALPDDSATKLAMSEDPWPVWMHILAHIADTATFSRADYVNAHGGNHHPQPLPRPNPRVEEERQQARNVHDALVSMMSGENPEDRALLVRDEPQAPQVEIDPVIKT